VFGGFEHAKHCAKCLFSLSQYHLHADADIGSGYSIHSLQLAHHVPAYLTAS